MQTAVMEKGKAVFTIGCSFFHMPPTQMHALARSLQMLIDSH